LARACERCVSLLTAGTPLGYGTRMTEPISGTAAGPEADDAAIKAAIEAARERQSHVRHELRAPLAVIYPLLSLMLAGGDGDLTAQQREHLEVLDRSVVRLEMLIAGVADSGWADCSAAPVLPTEVVLGDVVEEIVSLRRVDAGDAASIVVDTDGTSSLRAWADRDDVRQIVADLIRNAATYAPPDDTVTVRIGAGGLPATVVVEVADMGPGIPPEELPRVFDFGFRGELPRRLRTPGLGAGLWVCRQLAERNGGSVSLASEPGIGVTATLTLAAME
jgi:signal transduction histidine kinase